MSKAFCVDRFGEWQIARSLTHVRAAVGSRRRRGETRMCEIGSGGRRREGSHPAQRRGEWSGGSAVFDRFSHNGIMGA